MIIHVGSHRRSGTHALIDLLRARFPVQGGRYTHLEDLDDAAVADPRPILVKSHDWRKRAKLDRLRDTLPAAVRHAAERDCIYLYVHRDPYDVLRSLYAFNLAGLEDEWRIPAGTPFPDFLRQTAVQDSTHGEDRVSFWFRCLRNWLPAPGVTALSYDDVVHRPDVVLAAVSSRIGIAPEETGVTDSTAVGRDATRALGARDPWDADSLAYFRDRADRSILDRLGYALR